MTIYVLPFEKMHGLGNDFILIERRHLPNGVNLSRLANLICNRNFNIGADGIIIIDLSSSKGADFEWNYYNKDGSEGEMCGNGMRCFAKYVFERGYTEETSFSVLTKAGIIKPTIEEDGTVTVNMGMPTWREELKQNLEVDSKTFNYTYVEIGNPHCVIIQDEEILEEEFLQFGSKIENHKQFPNRINVEFAKVLNKNEIKLRVWERGSGPTLACGTGACATLVAAHLNGYTDSSCNVYLPGGCIKVMWDTKSKNVFLNGPASFVYTGQLNLDPALVCETVKKS